MGRGKDDSVGIRASVPRRSSPEVERAEAQELPPLKPIKRAHCVYLKPSVELTYPTGALIVLAGPAGIGKSTWAHKFFAAEDILSSDQMRKLLSGDESNMDVTGEAFALLHKVAAGRLKRGRTTVIDSTALSEVARNRLVALAQIQRARVHLILLDGNKRLCLERQGGRERQVHVDVIEKQLRQTRELRRLISVESMGDEGFSSAIRLTPARADAVKRMTLNPSI